MSKTARSRIALGVLIAAAPLGAMAQEQGGGAAVRSLDAVTVTATRSEKRLLESPVSQAVVTQEEMERHPRDSISEALSDIPGVEVEDSSLPGMKRVRIRGESTTRVLLLIDGQEVTDHRTYGSPILIDNDIVERVEVIKGPHSVLYGSKAVGGVINIITKKGGDRPVQATTSLTYDSAAEGWKAFASAYGSAEGFSYRVYRAGTRYDDRETPRGTLDNSAFSNDSLGVWAGYDFGGGHRLAFSYDEYDMETESHTDASVLTGSITAFQLDMPKRDREKIGAYYDWDNQGDGILRSVHFDVYRQTVDRLFVQDLTVAPGFPFVSVAQHIETNDELLTHGGTLQADMRVHPDHLVIVGAQFLKDEIDQAQQSTGTITRLIPPFVIPTASLRTDEMSQTSMALFAQDEWRLAPNWTLTGGLRHQWIKSELEASQSTAAPFLTPSDSSDSSLVGALALVYTGIQNTALRASFGQGYVTPTLLELMSGTAHGGGGRAHGNPNLEPETSNNYEVGARYQDRALTIDTAVFLTQAENYIATQSCAGVNNPVPGCTAADSYFTNMDEAETWGIEALVEYEFADLGLTPYASGALIRRTFTTAAGETQNTGLPKLSGRYGVRYETDLGSDFRFWSDAYLRSATGADEVDLSAGTVEHHGGWTTANLSLGLSYGPEESLRVALDLVNLTDKAYQPSTEDMLREGRSFILRVAADF